MSARQGRGIGSALVEARLRERGARAAWCWALLVHWSLNLNLTLLLLFTYPMSA